MPIISVTTSVTIDDEKFKAVQKLIVTNIAEVLGKNVNNMMFYMNTDVPMGFGLENYLGIAFVEIRNIGEITLNEKEAITKNIYEVLTSLLSVSAKYTYLNFTYVSRNDWSWGSKLL